MSENRRFGSQHNVIHRHLCALQTAATRKSSLQQNGFHSAFAAEEEITAEEMAQTLRHLLERYILLLEASDHGGWNQEEDNTVLSVCAALSRMSLNKKSEIEPNGKEDENHESR